MPNSLFGISTTTAPSFPTRAPEEKKKKKNAAPELVHFKVRKAVNCRERSDKRLTSIMIEWAVSMNSSWGPIVLFSSLYRCLCNWALRSCGPGLLLCVSHLRKTWMQTTWVGKGEKFSCVCRQTVVFSSPLEEAARFTKPQNRIDRFDFELRNQID